MDTDEALRLLRTGQEGVHEWNRRRGEGEAIPEMLGVSLQDAWLVGADLSECQLLQADLRGAQLHLANLSRASLQNANLENARLFEANLYKADLSGAKLQNAVLCIANCAEVKALTTDFENADLEGTKFDEADLRGARLGGARIDKAVLYGANLRGVGKARVWHALLPFYRLPFILNDNYVRLARFEPNSCDPWSVLRRTYTGISMVFILICTMAAFLPLVGEALFWVSISKMERQGLALASTAVQKSADAVRHVPDPAVEAWARKAHAFQSRIQPWLELHRSSRGRAAPDAQHVRETLGILAEAADALRRAKMRAAELSRDTSGFNDAEDWVEHAQTHLKLIRPRSGLGVRERHVWQLLLGTHEGFWATILGCALLAYNVARVVLTYSIGPLRDAEERSGYSPAWMREGENGWLGRLVRHEGTYRRIRDFLNGFFGYRWLWHLHQFATLLLGVSIGFGVYRLVDVLFTPVLVPG